MGLEDELIYFPLGGKIGLFSGGRFAVSFKEGRFASWWWRWHPGGLHPWESKLIIVLNDLNPKKTHCFIRGLLYQLL